jgi:hypothetical protein
MKRSEALREWFKWLATSEFSEAEVRAAMEEAADILPLSYIEATHIELHSAPFSVKEWKNCDAARKATADE